MVCFAWMALQIHVGLIIEGFRETVETRRSRVLSRLKFKNRIWKPALCFMAVLFQVAPISAQEPYRRMLDEPTQFSGLNSYLHESGDSDRVSIGLFVPFDPNDSVAAGIVRGVSIALDAANATGGYDGKIFAMKQRWANDPWGGGSVELAKLVFHDRVLAVIGSIDSHSTHIVQQIATKAHFPVMSPVVSDSTLTHIRVPWLFRLPPNDRVQSDTLVSELRDRGFLRSGLINTTDHESRTAARELKKSMEKSGYPPLFHFEIQSVSSDYHEIARRAKAFQPDSLVVRFQRDDMVEFLAQHMKTDLPVCIAFPWIPGVNAEELSESCFHGLITLEPFCPSSTNREYRWFFGRYADLYGNSPSFCAVYSYDAAKLIIEAVRRSGLNRKRLWETLSAVHCYDGASGTISWDKGGGNTTNPIVRVYPSR